MGLNHTPSAERIHIGIFGRRNAGKSSLINALTGQSLAIVSDVAGTTTDPVYKAMELLPLGPVVMIDTPGIDDEGELGRLRVQKSYQVLNKTDIAVLVINAADGVTREDLALLSRIRKKGLAWMLVLNKSDLLEERLEIALEEAVRTVAEQLDVDCEMCRDSVITVSVAKGEQIYELKEKIASLVPEKKPEFPLVADLVEPSDLVVLVVPIDKAAPKGRLILPQQQTIRDILEANAAAIVLKEAELAQTLKEIGKKPKMVITDSQVFGRVSKEIPKDVLLTSFSILFARYKGELRDLAEGVRTLSELKEGDKVLISEGCTHHRQCDDIGTVKLPRWISEFTGVHPEFVFTSGGEFPAELSEYKLIIHCGGCVLNEREMKYRIACARDAGVSMTNYGIAIAYMNGILKRSLEVFPDIWKLLL